jgi:hypothetical protein
MFGAASSTTAIAVVVIVVFGVLLFLVDHVFSSDNKHRRK